MEISRAKKALSRFKRVVIWGFATYSDDSFRHIYKGFYDTAKALGVKTLWLDDTQQNNKLVKQDDLVIVADMTAKYFRAKTGVYYCTHNFEPVQFKGMDPDKILHLQVYTDKCLKSSQKIDIYRYFDKKTKTLYQPWGTNLMPNNFMEPVYPWYSPFVYWIGSIWDNALHQGNLPEISQLKTSLFRHGKILLNPKFVSDEEGIKLIRHSRIAPAIGGSWQVKVNLLPCRLFKNISYGQLGITNIAKFKELFGDSIIYHKHISKVVDASLSLSKAEYISMVKSQQEIVKDYTYVSSLYHIAKLI
ncbi:MAG: hypothetical protein WCG44_01310 [bacterium]